MADRIAVVLNITWIAPEAPGQAPLQWLAELGAISELNGAKVTPIVGPAATVLGVSNALSVQSTDLVIWSGHGKPDGLLTSDGTILSGQWIATQIRAAMPRVFLVGACYSGEDTESVKSIVQQVSEAGVTAIGYTAAVDDKAAAKFAVEFTRAMLAGAEINVANDVAKQEASKLSSAITKTMLFMPALTVGMAPILKAIKEVTAQMFGVNNRISAIEINLIKLMSQMELLPTDFRTALREIKE